MRRGQFLKVSYQFESKLLDLGRILFGVGRHDFEIAALAEGEQGVARAAARMNTTKCGADAGGLFDEVDAAIEVGAAENEVIEQGGNVSAPTRKGCEGCPCCESDEGPPRNRHDACLEGGVKI